MIELLEHNGKLKVENYGLMDWVTDVQSAIQQGYEIDTSNEGYPQNFGSLYTCLMVESHNSGYVQNQLLNHNGLLAEEVQYLRKELKDLQEKTTSNGLVLTVELDNEPQFATGGLLPKTEHVVGEEVFVVAPFVEVVGPVVASEATNVAEKETEVDQESPTLRDRSEPAKRGPKPKNK